MEHVDAIQHNAERRVVSSSQRTAASEPRRRRLDEPAAALGRGELGFPTRGRFDESFLEPQPRTSSMTVQIARRRPSLGAYPRCT